MITLQKSEAQAHAQPYLDPVPALTPEQFIDKIIGLRPLIREQQAEAEKNAGYVQAVHDELLAFGGYRALQPKRYGGFEFDFRTFIRSAIEMGRSDPGSGWCYTFGAGHIVCLAAHYNEQAQDEIFGQNNGLALAPLRAPVPNGTMRKVEGGYIVNGTWDFGSGMRYATHVMPTARLVEDGKDLPPEFYVPVIPIEDVTVRWDSWGIGKSFGLEASGSHTFQIDNVFVPEHLVAPFSEYQRAGEAPDGTFGTRLHGNPMYLGLTTSFFSSTIASCVVGMAWAAIDELSELLQKKKTINPPFDFRYKSTDYQMIFGETLMEAKAADAALMEFARWYQQAHDDWAKGIPLTAEKDFEASALCTQAARMASAVVEKCTYAAGTSAAMGRMGRYYRAMATYRTHPIAQYLSASQGFAQGYFGLPVPMLEAVGGSRREKVGS
nr:hypothetical protein [uncultured Pseudomonas sp.]